MEQLSKSYDLSNLDDYKAFLHMQIDKKTEMDIFSGFTFDGGLFSMSLSAQINWSNLFFIPDAMYPLTISYKDDTGIYQLSLADRQAFYGAALMHKNTALQTGTALKDTVNSFTTIGECESFKDNLF